MPRRLGHPFLTTEVELPALRCLVAVFFNCTLLNCRSDSFRPQKRAGQNLVNAIHAATIILKVGDVADSQLFILLIYQT